MRTDAPPHLATTSTVSKANGGNGGQFGQTQTRQSRRGLRRFLPEPSQARPDPAGTRPKLGRAPCPVTKIQNCIKGAWMSLSEFSQVPWQHDVIAHLLLSILGCRSVDSNHAGLGQTRTVGRQFQASIRYLFGSGKPSDIQMEFQ